MIGMGTTIFLVNPQTFGGGSSFTNEKSLLFDGVDEYVTVGAISEITSATAFSVSQWVKVTTTSVGQFIWRRGASGNQIALQYNASNILIFFIEGNTTYASSTSSPLTINTWHNVTVVYDGTQGTANDRAVIYVDGVDVTNTHNGTHPTSTSSNTNTMNIGANNTGGQPWNGNIDEFAFYDYALTSGQVTSIFNSGTPTDLDNTSGVTAPVHWWRMGDSDTYPTITDVGTTGGNDGTMTNMESGDIVTDTP